jgi:cellulose synthase/poly-beta-1,6-N-acetylglucosamine synthase-like glycosyltransferase
VAAQTYPLDLLDGVMVDGCSEDATVEVAWKAATELGLELRVVDNPRRRTSTSLNVGLDHVAGEIVVRLDARSRVQSDYVATCVRVLRERPEVGVVGGAQIARSGSDALVSRGIARALRNRFFTGLSRYRRSTVSGPSDTVWMGVFRFEELRVLGGWDDRIALNEDFDLNQRYAESGLVVWFEASLRSTYVPRATFRALATQHFRFGRVKGTWWARDRRPTARQVVLLGAPLIVSAAAVGVRRRVGTLGLLVLGVGGLIALDVTGNDETPTEPLEVVASAAAGALGAAAWIGGTMAGYAGEKLGVTHPHG